MDVIVKWRDGSTNVVSSNEIESIDCDTLKVGVEIKMYWLPEKKYYYGKVIQVDYSKENSANEESESESMDAPLSILKSHTQNNFEADVEAKTADSTITKEQCCHEENKRRVLDLPISDYDDSDCDPQYSEKCQFLKCKSEASDICKLCKCLLCVKHSSDNNECTFHRPEESSEEEQQLQQSSRKKVFKVVKNSELPSTSMSPHLSNLYAVDGERREVPLKKIRRENKKNMAHKKRTVGEAYTSTKTKKLVPARN